MPPPASPASAALRRRGFLASGWPWRGLVFGLAGAVEWLLLLAPTGFVIAPLAGAIDQVTNPGQDIVAAGGLLLMAILAAAVILPLLAPPLLAGERWRAALLGARDVPANPPGPRGLWPWLRDRYVSPARWRHAAYVLLWLVTEGVVLVLLILVAATGVVMLIAPVIVSENAPISLGPWQVTSTGPAIGLTVAGVVLLAGLPYAWTAIGVGQVALLRRALAPETGAVLEARLSEVDRSRARIVDSFERERRRIERDLHDGAQQRLVTLAMNLGVSRIEVAEALGPDHPAASGVAAAHEQAKTLMEELRAFVRGIHPKVLTDVGLVAALDQLAASAPLSVRVTSTLTTRPPAHVESTAYFVAAEALTNVIRHSGATRAAFTIGRLGDSLVVELRDDGRGGADPDAGTGLIGMADRLGVVGGALGLSSPPGGPTVIRMTLPWPGEVTR